MHAHPPQSTLEFDLRLQEFVELARSRTPESLRESIVYARRHLLPIWTGGASKAASSVDVKESEEDRAAQEALRKQVQRAMGLLACGPGGWAYEVRRGSLLRSVRRR